MNIYPQSYTVWDTVTNLLSFTGVDDSNTWKEIFISSILIPVVIFLSLALHNWYKNARPLWQVLHGFSDASNNIYIFLSQLLPVNEYGVENTQQKYVIRYLNPIPSNGLRTNKADRRNISPVWPEAEGLVLGNIYNLLGKLKRTDNIHLGSLIHDWEKIQFPTICIGFNPKYDQIKELCNTDFTYNRSSIQLKDSNNSISPYGVDGAVIQKTYYNNTSIPIFILAGLGIAGTKASGYILSKYAVDFGKLYGRKPFCILIKTSSKDGLESSVIVEMTSNVSWLNKIKYPFVFLKYRKYFKESENPKI